MQKTLIFCLCISFCLKGLTQENQNTYYPRLVKLDVSKGISQNVVLSMTLDDDGFLWLGTMDGLNKYDGYHFDIYKKEFKVDSTYVNNFIHRIFSDPYKNMWVVKEGGSYIIDKNNKVEKIELNGERPSDFYKSTDNSIWVSTRSQNVYKMNLQDRSYIKAGSEIKSFISKEKDWILDFAYADDNSFHLVTSNGHVINYNSGELNFYKNPYYKESKFKSITSDADKNIWLLNEDGKITIFDPLNNSFFEKKIPNYSNQNIYAINVIYYDSSLNSIWLSTRRKGLFEYNLDTKKTKKYILRAPGSKIFDSENILQLVKDHSNGTFYLGTDQHGLFVWDPHLYKFEILDPVRAGAPNLDFRLPRKLESDNHGNIWIGSVATGLWRYNIEKDKMDVFTKSSHPQIIGENSAVQMLHQNDTLWIGHNGYGITKLLLPKMKKLDHFFVKGKEKELDNINVIWNLLKDKKDRLWIGTRSSGVFIKTKNEIKSINKYNNLIDDNTIYSLVEDWNKDVIICTEKGGLYKYEIDTDKITKVFPKADNNELYTSKTLEFDDNGFAWYATDGKGILLLDSEYNILTSADTDNGLLLNDVVCSIIPTEDKSIWVSTNFGLCKLKYNPQDTSIESQCFTQKDGLTSNEFMTGAYLKTNDTLWMGNMEGVNYFMPNKIKANPYSPKVYIRTVEINNATSSQIDSIYSLHHTKDNIGFEYNTKGFTIPENTFYSHRLIGYDSIWTSPSNRTFSRYTNLNPGEYEFQIKARNYDGVWNEKPTIFKFKIQPAFWQTKWFQFLALLGLIVGGVLLYKYRVNNIKKQEGLKNKFLKDLSEMEMKALRAQINPHFLFNTLNSINNYILQKDQEKASHYLVKFSKLMRLILTNSSQSFITLEDELDALDIYIELESMRFGNSFDFFLNIDDNINLSKIEIPPMLLQPFVENAIWHGLMHKEGEKVLSINISKTQNQYVVSIDDNGIGRDAAAKIKDNKEKHKSFGMSITQKRMNLINQINSKGQKSSIQVNDLYDEQNKSKGTSVQIFLNENLNNN